jgi:hypothetical protein
MERLQMRNFVLGLIVLAIISVEAAARANEKSLDERRKEFNQLVADEWEYEMRLSIQRSLEQFVARARGAADRRT